MDDDTDDKDDTKRRSRNLSEKKRRDQFNMLINELSSMVSTNNRKMDKSTVLKSTIAFLESHNELAVRSRANEIQEDWKPLFLSNEEFTHLILEAIDGFIIAFTRAGPIIYVSGSVTSLLGYLPGELMKPSVNIFDIIYEEDQATLYNILSNSDQNYSPSSNCAVKQNQIQFSCHVRRGFADCREEPVYELVHFVGYFRSDTNNIEMDSVVSSTNRYSGDDSMVVFVGTGRLDTPQLIKEMTISDGSKSEFTSRHNLNWKFLALDSRATPIIGYVQLEVVGTSGYDYYHIDDLDKIVVCHETLMEKGEGTSCFYRFLTKGQQWIWLQTRFYISYHQWNSKPEFIVCTHRVVSYVDVMNQFKKDPSDDNLSDLEKSESTSKLKRKSCSLDRVASSPWSSKSSVGQLPHIEVSSPVSASKPSKRHQGPGSDSASMSADSPASRHSQFMTLNTRPQSNQSSASMRKSLPMTKPPILSPAQASTTFIEPQHQYAVAAIPLQPIIGFQGTTVVTSIPTQELLCHSQTQLSDHVKRKQHELNQLRQLMYRKEEELQQCLLAQGRCGVVPSLINVTVPYSVPGKCSTSQSTHGAADLYVTPHSLVASPLTVTTISPSDIRLQPANSSSESHSGGMFNDQNSQSDSELIPFQFSQQQAQLLFTNISPPESH